jgi:hypothetical protein
MGDSNKQPYESLVENKESVFFLGESPDRSLPIALAAMRGSFNRIWASSKFENFKNFDAAKVLKTQCERSDRRWFQSVCISQFGGTEMWAS